MHEHIIEGLRRVPEEIEALCAGLSDDGWRRRPADGGWSPLEAVCHLRDAAAEEGLRGRRLLEEDEPTLVPYDPDARAEERNYRGEDPRRALMALRAFWTGLAYQLEHLTPAEWERSGTHPEHGRVTVLTRAETALAHAREHIAAWPR